MKKVFHFLKRSSQTKRIALILAAPWSAAIFLVFGWHLWELYDNMLEVACIQAKYSYEKDLVYRRWAASHGGVYVPVTEETPPNPYLSHVKNRDVTTTSGLKLTLVNPAYMTRQVHELGLEQYGLQGHMTSLNPLRPENAPDAWEAEALGSFERGATEVIELAKIGDAEHLRMMRPMIVEARCLKCHASQGYKEGDLRGGISVSTPMAPLWAVTYPQMAVVTTGYALIWLLGLGGIAFGASRIERRTHERERAKEALSKSQQRSTALLKAIPDLMFRQDSQGVYLDYQADESNLYVQAPNNIIGKSSRELLPPELANVIHQKIKEILASGEMQTFEYQLSIPERGVMDFEARMVKSGDEEATTIVRDITERKGFEGRMEGTLAQLRESDGELRNRVEELDQARTAALNMMSDAEEARKQAESAGEELRKQQFFLEKAQDIGHVGAWDFNTQKNVLFWTDENYRIFGVPIGTELTYEIFQNCIHPDDREYVNTEWKAALHGKPYDIEHRLLVDGKVKWVREKAELEFDEKGECLRGTGVTQDITERKEGEEALRESEEYLRSLYKAADNVAFITTDLAGEDTRILDFSPGAERIYGYTRDEAIGQLVAIIHPPEQVKTFPAIQDSIRKGKKGFSGESVLVRKSGERFPALFTIHPRLDTEGNVVGTVRVALDITDRKRMEEELRTTTNTLNNILDSSPEHAIAAMDLDFRIIRYNPAADSLFGYKAQEVIGRTIMEVHDEENIAPERFERAIKAVGKVGKYEYDMVLDEEDGRKRHLHSIIFPMCDEKKNHTGYLLFTRDITERKRVELALEWESKVNASIAEFSSALISLKSIDDISCLVLEQGKKITGSPFGFVGQIDQETGALVSSTLTRDIWDTCQVADKTLVFHEFSGLWGCVLNTGKVLMTNSPAEHKESSGTPEGHLPIKRFLSVPVMMDGELLGQVALANSDRDYMERDLEAVERLAWHYALAIQRKRAEEALSASRASFHNIVERTKDGMVVASREGKVRYANPGTKILLARESEDGEGWELGFELGSGRIEEIEVPLSEEESRVLEMRVTDTKWEGQEAYLVSLRDISARKRAQKKAALQQLQLVHADKMVSLGVLVSGVAHEINNPNSFIMLNVPLLTEAWEKALPILNEYYTSHGDFPFGALKYSRMREKIPQLLSGMFDGSQRIKRIVEGLKDYARDGSDDALHPVQINKIVDSTAILLQNMIKKSTRHFSIHQEENLPSFRANSQKIEQVTINLIQNACQALTNIQQKIDVSTYFDDNIDMVVIEVRDEGKGIDAKDLPRIQDPFFTTKRGEGGTGLGLSVSSGIVSDYGGTLSFESVPGEGTRARLSFPAVSE